MKNDNTDFMNDIFLNSKSVYKETDNELLNFALHYARCGFPVIPLHNLVERYGILQCSCRDGANCSTPGKHPRTRFGSKDATTDENKIFDWWDDYPNANIGLLAGKNTGFFVLDIDIRAEKYPVYNGEITLEELRYYYQYRFQLLKKNYTPLPATLTAFSGSGSRHLYFKYPLGMTIKNSNSKIASDIGLGLDIKSDGNYIIAPPSNHKSGNQYEWFGINTSIEDAPNWLIYEIQIAMQAKNTESLKSTSKQNSKSKLSREKIPVTRRNTHFHKHVCGLVNSYSKEEVLRRAFEMNDEIYEEPLEEKEIIRTVNWAWKKYGKSKGKNMAVKK